LTKDKSMDLDRILAPAIATPTQGARDIMRLSIMDWMACALPGVDEPVSRICRQMVLDEAGAGQAMLFGGGRAPMRSAALVNGTISHALDYDDTHFAHIGHPSVAVVSAAFAVAEHEKATLDQFIDAALAGTEASVRFGKLFGRAHYQIGFHQTATAGAFGATLAAAQLLGLSRDQVHHALGLVSTRASGLKSQFGTMGKPYNAGIAASNGVEAALLAQKGMVSDPKAIWGQNGFLSTHHTDGVMDETPGFLMEQVSHKFHACCHGLHASLEALALLKPQDPGQIHAIHVETHPRWMTVCNQPSPTTGLEAKFSYRTVMALSLLGYSTAALKTFDDQHCNDPQVIALRDKVQVSASDALSETEALVRLETEDGDLEAHFDLNAPMSFEARAERVYAKAAALVGEEKAQSIRIGLTTSLESLIVAAAG
jgi:2-methylcitrate dehydratase PrpD